jgi:hypothetical protein
MGGILMEFVRLTISVPVPSRRWFRFSVKSLLFLMLFVASICLGWRVYRSGQHARLISQLEEARRARDNALQNWKLAANSHLTNRGLDNINREAIFRSEYFKHRTAVDTALQRLTRYEGVRPEIDSPSAHD